MTVSIALCTYNGEKFLKDQLDSFTNQTNSPDELIICDDNSTDNTIQIIKTFQQTAPFNVRLYINESRLGSTKNFERAISLTRGDVIFLSDQDDWWHPEKIRTILDCFEGKCGIICGGVFSDAEIVDESLNYQDRNLWDSIGFDKIKRKNFEKGDAIPLLLKWDIVTGATLAFDAKFKNVIIPIPEVWVHDTWISLLLAYMTDLHMIEQPLIKYRQHSHQQIGIGNHSFSRKIEIILAGLWNRKDYYSREAEKLTLAYERILHFPTIIKDPCSIELLMDNIDHLEARATMKNFDASRIVTPLKELLSGRYHKYSQGWNSFFKDLIIGH
jgi:glycosyltransferase involved in cell wall biosynthesis